MRVRPDFPRPPHQPGQYCTLGLGYWEPRRRRAARRRTLKPGDETKLVRRAYSISCSVLDDPADCCDLDEDRLAGVLHRPRPREPRRPRAGPDAAAVHAPARATGSTSARRSPGHYTLEPVKPGDTVVFLGTGTGEAPHNYMLWELLRRGHTGQDPVGLLRPLPRATSATWTTHEELMRRYPNYKYLPLTTREAGTDGQKVYIQDLITSGELEEQLGEPLDPATTHVFLCGNPKMIGVPVKDKETGRADLPAAARRDRDPGEARVPGRRRGGEGQGQHPLRRVLVSDGRRQGGRTMADINEVIGGYKLRNAAADRADVAGVRGGRADQQPALRHEAAAAGGGRRTPEHRDRRCSTRPRSAIKLRAPERHPHPARSTATRTTPYFIMEFFPSGQPADCGSMAQGLRRSSRSTPRRSSSRRRPGLAYMNASGLRPPRREAGQHPGQRGRARRKIIDFAISQADPDRASRKLVLPQGEAAGHAELHVARSRSAASCSTAGPTSTASGHAATNWRPAGRRSAATSQNDLLEQAHHREAGPAAAYNPDVTDEFAALVLQDAGQEEGGPAGELPRGADGAARR